MRPAVATNTDQGPEPDGGHKVRPVAVASGGTVDDDPMARVLGLGRSSSGVVPWLGYGIGAIVLMVVLLVTVRAIAKVVESDDPDPNAASQEIEVAKDDPPPPPTPTEKPPEPPEPPHALKEVVKAQPPPAPAQAAKVLTREPDPNEPVDLTANTIVTGNADTYAGGVTATDGTSANAVRGLTSPHGVAGAPPAPAPAPAPAGPDRSRPPSFGNKEWSCPFPPEADTSQIDDAYVTLQLDVRADGTVSNVRVLVDPGEGFGREARRYALGLHLQPALDHDGHPIAQVLRTRVHFFR